MGQNDPPHTDDLSVTKIRPLHLIGSRGMVRKEPHRTSKLSVTPYNPRGYFVHVDISPCKCGCRALHKSINGANNEA